MDRDTELHKARRIKDPLVLSTAEWVQSQIPKAMFFTGTYRNDVLDKRCVGSDWAAFRDFKQVLHAIGFNGTYFVALDDNNAGVIHVHAIVEDTPAVSKLGPAWKATRGVYRIGPAVDGAYLYCSKHAVKTNRYGDSRYQENFKRPKNVVKKVVPHHA